LKSQASSFNVNQKKIDLYIAEFRSKLDNEDIAQIKKEIPAMAINAKRSYTELLFNIKRKADHKDSKGHLDSDMTLYVFDNPGPALMIGLMQLTSALLVEFLNLVILTGQRNVFRSIGNFVSVRVISNIDDIYRGAVNDSTINRIIAGGEKPLVIYRKVAWDNRSFSNKLMYSVWRLIKTFYLCVYFYFFPFLIIFMNFYNPHNCFDDQVVNFNASVTVGREVTDSVCSRNLELTFMFTSLGKTLFK
jgi:hypothetical protein